MMMVIGSLIKPGEFHDSVSLMLAAREITSLEGVLDAAVVMATEANLTILQDAGLSTEDARHASPNDLIIAIKAKTNQVLKDALQKAEIFLRKKGASDGGTTTSQKTIRGALVKEPEANVAVISVAGRYAANEAWGALTRGLHVLLFSDNVSLEDEIALKEYARDHGLLLMGPGAGTAILNHVALGFANVVSIGTVGIVSAAGTGLQEVSTLLTRFGVGITQAIGTGGRDLKKEVGGIMMLEGLKALQCEPTTEVLVLISKPPDATVTRKIFAQVAESNKPTVICFLGDEQHSQVETPNLIQTGTLQECAFQAAKLALPEMGDYSHFRKREDAKLARLAGTLRQKLAPRQRYLRGLFSGGTLCYETQVIWKQMNLTTVYSNAPLPGGLGLDRLPRNGGHTIIDLGEEEFTVGRPHPMIDNDLRIRRILQEARDPQVAVILLDVVLGYGSHPDPAAELGKAVVEAHEISRKAGQELLVIASVTGTEEDPQCYSRTVSALKRAGTIVCDSNAAAARLSGLIVSNQPGRADGKHQ